jgi:hypothetical protein
VDQFWGGGGLVARETREATFAERFTALRRFFCRRRFAISTITFRRSARNSEFRGFVDFAISVSLRGEPKTVDDVLITLRDRERSVKRCAE